MGASVEKETKTNQDYCNDETTDNLATKTKRESKARHPTQNEDGQHCYTINRDERNQPESNRGKNETSRSDRLARKGTTDQGRKRKLLQ